MKFVLDCRWVRGKHIDGISRYTLNILRSLNDVNVDAEYILLFSNEEAISLASNYCNLSERTVIKTKHPVLSVSSLLTQCIVDRLNPDIYITFNYPTAVYGNSFVVARLIHDLTPLIYYDEACDTIKTKMFYYTKYPTRIALKYSDILFTVSDNTRKDLREMFNLKASKVFLAPCSVDANFAKNRTLESFSEIRKKYGVQQPYILSLSRAQKFKNLSTLLRAYYNLPEHIKRKYALVLAGTKPSSIDTRYDDDIKKIIRKENILFTGYIEEEHLPSIYRSAAVFCFPSKYEGFGLPLLEAMVSSTPVISSSAASLPEVGGNAPLYFDPSNSVELSNKIVKVVKSSTVRRNMVRKGEQQIANFSWKETAQTIIYKTLEKAQRY